MQFRCLRALVYVILGFGARERRLVYISFLRVGGRHWNPALPRSIESVVSVHRKSMVFIQIITCLIRMVQFLFKAGYPHNSP